MLLDLSPVRKRFPSKGNDYTGNVDGSIGFRSSISQGRMRIRGFGSLTQEPGRMNELIYPVLPTNQKFLNEANHLFLQKS